MKHQPDQGHIPRSALQFDRGAPTPESYRFRAAADPAQFDKAAEGAKRRFSGVAYSGEAIENHWYWGRVVFDLATTKAPKKLPMLMGHDRDKVAGFADDIKITDKIEVAGALSSFTEDGKQVAALSDEGFPWQQSVHIEPMSVEEVRAGATVTVNGRQFSGPINVFRNNTIREVSFTPTGWDPNTSAVAMSHGGDANTTKESSMTPEEIKALQDKATKFEADAKAEKERADKAAADAAAADVKVKAFEKEKAEAAKSKREADIKALFEKTGVAFKDETAKPYRTMDEETFQAVAKDLIDSAATRNADPSLFSERATAGAGANTNDPQVLAERARVLMAQAAKDGRVLPADEAVRMAAKQAA